MFSREVDRAQQAQQQQLIDIFSEGFSDDPMFNWMSPKPCLAGYVFELLTESYMDLNLSFIQREGAGATLWQGPGQQVGDPIDLSALWRGFRLYGFRALWRVLRVGRAMEKHHPKEPHYYLFAIATQISARGQGVGSLLLAHTLRKADEQGVGAYLENSKQDNLAFYRGHGFEVIRELVPVPGAPTLYLMWREPQPV
ncbi:acetyltransferase (GNAT) family protein [Sinobacterium caligoides]|uniref:Acetyltransferase (GNAT) family protein n=1 Tax=Sinobacterium caligoides TaxID=933926 RepID=A0A3N2DMH6_9GAMM|nr:GNAT family N-acetyltransferase [Sinobacterium caligoides]ROS01008.1 acetyltransferase (GNAT) family protein [Sinobacterium caligoides]